MSRLSEISVYNLRRIRWFLLFRHAETNVKDRQHANYGIEIDKVSIELNKRTGETKYKA